MLNMTMQIYSHFKKLLMLANNIILTISGRDTLRPLIAGPHRSPSRSSDKKVPAMVSSLGSGGTFPTALHGWDGWERGVGLPPATSHIARLGPWGSPIVGH